jgi:hypothetical protein
MGTFQRGDRGLDVTRLEIALMELGLYSGVLDDFFGPTLENSVRLYQARKGLLTTGISDDQTTAAILAEPSPRAASLRDKPADYRSLTLTASFETSIGPPECFSGLAGDFDGQGISFGVLQWNLGQGTLQPLLRKLDMAHPEVVKAAFGDGYQELRTMLTKSTREQLAWARKIQTANRRSLVEPWRSRFKALGATRECQQIQVEREHREPDPPEDRERVCTDSRLTVTRAAGSRTDADRRQPPCGGGPARVRRGCPSAEARDRQRGGHRAWKWLRPRETVSARAQACVGGSAAYADRVIAEPQSWTAAEQRATGGSPGARFRCPCGPSDLTRGSTSRKWS